jgi:hypothetical protein
MAQVFEFLGLDLPASLPPFSSRNFKWNKWHGNKSLILDVVAPSNALLNKHFPLV